MGAHLSFLKLDLSRVKKYSFIYVSCAILLTVYVDYSKGQTLRKYGFKASFPCDLKKQMELGDRMVDPTGEYNLKNWVAFQCLDKKSEGVGVLFRVISSRSEVEMKNTSQYAEVACDRYSDEGWGTEIAEYRGRDSCFSKTTTNIMGKEFKQWSLDFASQYHGFMISVVSNTGNIENEIEVLASSFDIIEK